MPRIFISYRRTDSAWAAAPVYEFTKARLTAPGDHVFMDREELTLGRNFEEHIKANLSGCDVVLALIGPTWLRALQDKLVGQDPDYVRMELSIALTRGIPVVPVLLDNAPMPRADDLPDDLKTLVKRHGIVVGQQNFEADAARLLKGIGVKVTAGAGRKTSAGSPWRSLPILLTLGATAAIVALQHFLDFQQGDVAPALIGFGSMAAGALAAGGHGLTGSRTANPGVFLAGLVSGLAAIAAMMVTAGVLIPEIAGVFALLLSQLVRDASAVAAAVSGYLVGILLRRKSPRSDPGTKPTDEKFARSRG